MSRQRRSWTEKLQSDRPFEINVIDRPMPGWPAAAANQPVEPSARETKPWFIITKMP